MVLENVQRKRTIKRKLDIEIGSKMRTERNNAEAPAREKSKELNE